MPSYRLAKVRRTDLLGMEDFDPKFIVASLMNEAGLDEETAWSVAKAVEEKVRGLKLRFLSGPLIRELVCAELLNMGLEEARARYTRVGMPLHDVDELLEKGEEENANLSFNPESIHKWAADRLFIEHALLTMPKHIADAHIEGMIHIHDLEYWSQGRPFCCSHDPRFLFKRGLITDPFGLHTAVAGPAKHWETAVMHMCEWLGVMQTCCAGGQGMELVNIFLAPFLAGKPYEVYKQAAQMFVYNMEQMYTSRGGQVVFSSISITPTVPKILRDLPAVLPGGKVSESLTYGDFEEEANRLFHAFIDVYMEGDYVGKPFNFPKLEVQIVKDFEKYEEDYIHVAQLAAKFGTPYFLNLCPDYMPDEGIVHSQCCRLIFVAGKTMAQCIPLTEKDIEDVYEGRIRSTSLHYTTINLPRIAYEAKGDDDRLFELIDERMELAKESLLVRRQIVGRALKNGRLGPLSMDVGNGDMYYPFDRAWHNIGFVGLTEMLKAHIGEELHESKYAWDFGLKVVAHMREKVDEYMKETGLRWGLLQTPAESTCYRLARIDLKKFGEKAVVKGDRRTGAVYYTNSSHVWVGADIPLPKRIMIEASFHPLTSAGAILHVWLGQRPDYMALWKLTARIARRTPASYFAYTLDYTVCPRCWYTGVGLLERCPRCGNEDVEWYSRITGYYSRVSRWNAGKIAELRDRRRY